ncbi:MAG TPA: helix-turn-helix domain-containing protein [Dehalococcoidia bacterium]|nr:helix-turn-helix domain-containing protein [Dehalococcoidia bacterium]
MARVTDAHIEARKSQILDAAWTCFARTGYHRTTMQDIASEAGISAGAIYHYFEGKEAVLAAINQRSQEVGRNLVASAAAGDGDPIRSIAVIGAAMMRFFHDPEFETIARINMEIWPEILRNDRVRSAVGQEIRFWRETVTGIITEAQDRGDLRADVNAQALAQIMMCAWEGMRHYRTVDQGFGPEALVELFRSLLSEKAAARRIFDEVVTVTPIGIPHAMPTPRADSRRRVNKAGK